MNFVEELTWRGMIHTIMPGTEEILQKEMISAYVGIDPTADSLHIGHLVGVMMLKYLQESGQLIPRFRLLSHPHPGREIISWDGSGFRSCKGCKGFN